MSSSLLMLFKLINKKERTKLFLLVLSMCFAAVLEMIGIGLIPAFIVLISTPDKFFETFKILSSWNNYYTSNPEGFFIVFSIFLIVVFIIKNIFVSYVHYYKVWFALKFNSVISTKLFKSYCYAPWNFHINKNSAEILRNVNNECGLVSNAVLLPFLNLIMDIVLLLLIFVLLFTVDPFVSVLTLTGLGLASVIFLYFTNKKLKNFGRNEVGLRKQRNKTVIQTLESIKELTIYNKINFFIKKYNKSAVKTAKAQTYKQLTAYLPRPFLEVFAISGIFIVSIVFIFQGREFDSMLPILTLFGVAAVKIIPTIKQILLNFSILRFNHFSVIPIYRDLMTLKNQITIDNKENTEKIIFNDKIEIENVCFQYPEKKTPVIKNFSTKINKGYLTVIKGSSGSGKTTLLNLVSGILTPVKGQILVDGKDIIKNIRSWQDKISYVPQNVFLFDSSIKNNIAPGLLDHEVDISMVNKALKIAQLEEFITSLPEGLDTKVGERGIKISGGQRQRIGIARAIYHKPELLILDEATSEVDLITEQKILKEIKKIKAITILYVGHKQVKSDFFKQGHIIEV